MIRLSICSVFAMNQPLEAMLKACADSGYARLELVCLGEGQHIDITQWDAAELREACEAYGIEPIALYTKPIDVHADDRFRASLEYIKYAIDVAAEIPCGRIVFSPLLPRENYDYGRLAEGCRELADYIGERDVTICLENHHEWPMSYTRDYATLFEMIDDPRIGATIDTGHFTSSKVDMIDMIGRFGGRIKHVHLKERRGTDHVPFGEGETNMPAIIERLRESGYDGYASVELESLPSEEIPRQLPTTREYCERVLGVDST
ncbi:MAG TPA: sugar phosphate isomerase/epimerase [Armatimonadota bacterium]|nr:sugar phosphate isomerase/epimerase [Armatimonadota bacterium]